MKKIILLVLVLVLAAALCIGLTGCIHLSINGSGIKGNGEVVTEEISLSKTLTGAVTQTSIDIVIDPALEGKAVLEGEENILDLVEVNQSAGILTVDFKPSYQISWTHPVTLRVPKISGGLLETSSSGSISMLGSDALEGDSFELRGSSSGSITVAIEAEKLKAIATSSGSINVTGRAAGADIELSSSGSFNGFGCQTETVNAQLSSSGTANVSVSGELSGSLSSSGCIYYDGDPAKVNVSSSSSGQARKR